jgi:hypothetical protein
MRGGAAEKGASITYFVNLLKLSAEVRRAIVALPAKAGRDCVTEFALRRIATLKPAAQRSAFGRLVE